MNYQRKAKLPERCNKAIMALRRKPLDIMTTNPKKERAKLNPEQLYEIYLECNAPGAPVKTILARYGLKPWDLVAIRKKVKTAAVEALANPGRPGRRQQSIPVEQYQKVSKELSDAKDALSAVAHELALLKKRTS
jgi:hypothetical protein